MAEPSSQKNEEVTMKIRNDSGHTISLISIKVWQGLGNRSEPFVTIKNGDVGAIAIRAWKAALVLKIEHDHDAKIWVLVWNTGLISKVFTDIVNQLIDWEHIGRDDNVLGKSDYEIVKFGYKAGIKFDPDFASSAIIDAYIEKITLTD